MSSTARKYSIVVSLCLAVVMSGCLTVTPINVCPDYGRIEASRAQTAMFGGRVVGRVNTKDDYEPKTRKFQLAEITESGYAKTAEDYLRLMSGFERYCSAEKPPYFRQIPFVAETLGKLRSAQEKVEELDAEIAEHEKETGADQNTIADFRNRLRQSTGGGFLLTGRLENRDLNIAMIRAVPMDGQELSAEGAIVMTEEPAHIDGTLVSGEHLLTPRQLYVSRAYFAGTVVVSLSNGAKLRVNSYRLKLKGAELKAEQNLLAEIKRVEASIESRRETISELHRKRSEHQHFIHETKYSFPKIAAELAD